MKLLFETTETKDLSFNDYSVIVESSSPKEPQKLKITRSLYSLRCC